MPFLVASFACGLIFGAGLMISGMTDPAKVLGFLDIFGAWDATLALVMAGAVAVSGLGFAIARRRGTPVLAERSFWPTRTDIDAQLLIAGGLFGIGWGMVGFCPGPALVNLAGVGFGNFLLANVLVGVGWNFAFVGGSSLLTTTYTPSERAKVQASHDVMVYSATATAASV